MNKTVIILAGIVGILDAFVKNIGANVAIFIIVGIAAAYFGFKMLKETKIGGTIAILVGLEFFIFGFVKSISQYGATHIVISIILGLMLLIAPFISNFVKA